MSLIVEDGTIVANANSYVTTAYAINYLAERGLSFTDETESYLEELAVQAKDWLEQQSFIGIRATRDQVLQWPRDYVCIDGFDYLRANIPSYLLYSQVEVMYAIDSGDSPLSNRTLFKEEVKVGPIAVKYKEQYTHYDNRRIHIYLSKIIEPEQLTIERR